MNDENPNPHAVAIRQGSALAELNTMEGLERVAKHIATSGMFGCQRMEQALALMLLCQAENIHPMLALRRYHMVDGKPSMRADAMQGEFTAKHGGGIIWHVRTDEMVAATFFARKEQIDDKSRERAIKRFDLLWSLMTEDKPPLRSKLMVEVAKLSVENEETIIRTIQDADDKKVSMAWDKEKNSWKKKHNWQQSPRQMLTARTITEGVRLVRPEIIAGIYSTEEEQDMLADRQAAPRTRGEIETEIARIREQALNTENGNERNRLLALVADLQYELEQLPGAPKPIGAVTVIEPEKPVDPVTTTEPEKPETKVEKPKAEKIKGKKAEDKAPADPVAPAPEKPAAPVDNPPGAVDEVVSTGLPPEIGNHVIAHVRTPQFGMAIKDIPPADIKKLKEKWVDAMAESIAKGSPEKKQEARHVLNAYRHYEASGAYAKPV